MEKLPVLRVRLLGTESVTYGDTPILYARHNVTKALKLLLILLYSGKEGIARKKLLDDLFGREEVTDASNNLRVTVHRLKKALVESGLPEYEYIVSRGGKYYWDSPMEVQIDTEVFQNLLARAEMAEHKSEKIALLKEACRMYGGEFLRKMSGDEWAVLESVKYKELYVDAMEELCELLLEQKEYEEALSAVDAACELYPFDEWQSVKIDCYIRMNRYKDALKEYDNTAKLLIEELGITPSEKMMKQFQVMSDNIKNRPQIISEIKGDLQETQKENGAFFCSFPSFLDAYRIIRRGMERSGQSVFMLLCTLTDNKGRPMENSEKLEEMSNELFHSIKSTLRRSDSFTKYNPAQYLIILMGINEENCQIVIDRITKHFSRENKAWANYLHCSVTSLYDKIY